MAKNAKVVVAYRLGVEMKRKPFETSCDGIAIRGELFLPKQSGAITVVPLCHGIPREGPRQGDPGYLPVAQRLAESGYGALMFNFRGCGVSDGDFDIAGWGRDLVAVAESLAAMPQVERIVPWGFSGGAAASVWAAAHSEKIAATALFACPAEFAALKAVPVGSALVEYFRKVGIIRDPDFPPDAEEWLKSFESITPENHIGRISPRPVFIIHGTADETVPVEHAHRLDRAAKEPKQLLLIENGPHRLRESPEAIDAAFEWLGKI